MKILYYTWGECTYQDCAEAMKQMGWQIDVVSYVLSDYDHDDVFMDQMMQLIKSQSYDCIFSFDFFPILARVAREGCVKYISWVYDCPHYTLYSETLESEWNEVYVFDPALVRRFRGEGKNQVHYMPLACNGNRMRHISQKPLNYEHEITFLGNLYDDKNDLYAQIKYLPEELKGYIEGLMESQQLIYGYDLIEGLFDHGKCQKMSEYVKAGLGKGYSDCRDEILRDMIRKRITVLERRRILTSVGNHYELDLYSAVRPEGISCRYLGYADYYEQMPEIFRGSKINLNMTLRSIQEGIPQRVIDVLGSGGFLLTNYQPDMMNYFENGVDLVWYESREDLLDKVSYYLKHEDQRKAIAENGRVKAEQFFTYEKLLPQIFQMIE